MLLACGLWFYVINVENPTGSIHLRDLPITVQGDDVLEENGLMVTALNRDDASIKVTGKRKTLLKLNRKDVSLTVDTSSVTGEGEWPLTAKVVWPSYVSTESLSVSDWDRLRVNVVVERKETRQVPVQGEFIGTAKDGFSAGRVETAPETVELTGPAAALEGITCAVAQVGGEEISETLEQKSPLTFVGEDGVPVDMAHITASETAAVVTVPVWKVVSVPLTVNVIDGGGARASDAVVSITPKKIRLTEPAEEDTLPESICLGELRLEEVLDTTSYAFPIQLPEGAVGWDVPDIASVEISLDRLASRSFVVEEIRFLNAPSGYQVQKEGGGLTVWVRGDPSVVSKLKAEQLAVTVDLSKAKKTDTVQRFPAQIAIQDVAEDAQVGVVGTKYSVAVRLTR